MTILMLWFYVLSIVSCFFKVADSEVDYKVYIKPDGSRECPGEEFATQKLSNRAKK